MLRFEVQIAKISNRRKYPLYGISLFNIPTLKFSIREFLIVLIPETFFS